MEQYILFILMILIHNKGEDNLDIKIPLNLHNKYLIEVKDVISGEIVNTGYAENIVLNNLLSSTIFCWYDETDYVGRAIHFGRGTGTLSPSRTTLFNQIGQKDSELVEFISNQTPVPSYCTKKIVINPAEYVGDTFTEVGIGGSKNDSNLIFTHALIRDSEGNSLTLGPKKDTQEITIYSTTYFKPNFENGITLYNATNPSLNNNMGNGIIAGFTFKGVSGIRMESSDSGHTIRTDIAVGDALVSNPFKNTSSGVLETTVRRFQITQANGKIKKILGVPNQVNTLYLLKNSASLEIDLIVLAENNSSIWSGWGFDKTPVGIGDGIKTVFNLTWDEVWMDKPKVVYIDGVQVTSGFTFNAGNITFDTAPPEQAVITADYWVKYIPKDTDHVLDVKFSVIFGEGSAS